MPGAVNNEIEAKSLLHMLIFKLQIIGYGLNFIITTFSILTRIIARTDNLVLELTSSSRTNDGDGGGGDVEGAGGEGGEGGGDGGDVMSPTSWQSS